MVGGSGLYVRAVLDNLEFPGTDPGLRDRLEGELAEVGPAALHARLARLDPAAAAAILPGTGAGSCGPSRCSSCPAGRSARRCPATSPSTTTSCRSACACRGRSSTSASPAGSPGCGGPGSWRRSAAWPRRACARADRQPGARLRAGAALPGRGVVAGAGRRGDRAGHAAVRAPPGVVVPAGSEDHLAGRRGPPADGAGLAGRALATIRSCGLPRATGPETTS